MERAHPQIAVPSWDDSSLRDAPDLSRPTQEYDVDAAPGSLRSPGVICISSRCSRPLRGRRRSMMWTLSPGSLRSPVLYASLRDAPLTSPRPTQEALMWTQSPGSLRSPVLYASLRDAHDLSEAEDMHPIPYHVPGPLRLDVYACCLSFNSSRRTASLRSSLPALDVIIQLLRVQL